MTEKSVAPSLIKHELKEENIMAKAAIYTVNQGAQALQIGSVISLGSIIRRFGCKCNNALDLNGNGITINEPGYYDVDASITATAAAAGTVTATLLRDGVAVPGAVASATATAAAAGTVALPITALVRKDCGCSGGSTLTLVLGGTAATINNVALKVIKL